MATTCAGKISLTIPMVVDDMKNSVANAYNAMPDRIFILSADRKIVFRGDRGPRGFDVEELDQELRRILAKGQD